MLGIYAVEGQEKCREQADDKAGSRDGKRVQVAVGGYCENAGKRADNGYYFLKKPLN